MRSVADDPRLKMFLDAWQQDVSDGMTVRSLHRRLDEHEDFDAKRFDDHARELETLRLARARDEGVAEGTGRHKIVPERDSQRPERHRSSWPPSWIRKALSSGIAKGVYFALAVGVGWLVHHLAWH